MPEMKLSHVVSCSSEENQHPAENLLRPQSYKKWKCKPGEKQAVVIIQLEKASKLQSIDIGNEGSAFIEVLGGKSTNEDEYTVIVPTSGFMTPDDGKKQTNLNGVRFFDFDKLTKAGREEKWDRIKIICTQPFNQTLGFGLSFVRLHVPASENEARNEGVTEGLTLGKFKLRDDVDESGISKRFKRDFAPGALFLAQRKAGENSERSSEHSPANNASVSAKKNKAPLPREDKRKMAASKTKDSSKAKESNTSVSSTTPKTRPRSPKEEEVVSRREQNAVSFTKLFDGVVFVLSGFQNPLRSQLRDQATEMGATYRSDWSSGCTHLICAFVNTPKYNQVKGKGIIVQKEWILDSYKKRSKLDWRRYAFEPTDDDSDDQEVAIIAKPGSATSGSSPSSRAVNGKSQSVDNRSPKKPEVRGSTDFDPYNASTDYSSRSSPDYGTDDEIERVRAAKRKADASGKEKTASTKCSTEEQSTKGLPDLPECFSGLRFFLFGGFPNHERKQLNRYIVALGGVVEQYMGNKVTHVLTRESWDASFDEALEEFRDIIFVQPEFVLVCGKNMSMVDIEEYIVKKP